MIFEEDTIRKINRLTLVASQVRAGMLKGERRSTKRGASIEFADYRNYTAGDDLRRLDWNVFARLDRPFIKLMEEQEDLAVHILVDSSLSMDWGEGESNKFKYALHLAAAIASIALSSGDRLAFTLLRPGYSSPIYGPVRGAGHFLPLLELLEDRRATGETDLNRSLRDYAFSAGRPGLLFLISDLFSPSGYEAGIQALYGRGYELVVLQVLAPDEIEPALAGDLRLLDVETGLALEASLDREMLEGYRQKRSAWQNEIRIACQKRGGRYLPINTSQNWERVLLQEMRSMDVVK